MEPKDVTLKKMDPQLWARVKIASIRRGKTISYWMTEAIRVKLRKENG